MKEYFDDILKPAIKALKPGEAVLSFLLALVPIINIFTIPGYFFNAAGYLAGGKSRLPRVRLGKAFYSTLYLCVTIFILIIFGWILGIAIVSPAKVLLLISKQLQLPQGIIIFFQSASSLSDFIFLEIFLFLLFVGPILLVRFAVYRYYSRILDFRHILRLVLTKDYLLSFAIVSVVSLLVISTGLIASSKVAGNLGFTMYVNLTSIVLSKGEGVDIGNVSFLYFVDVVCFFIIAALGSVIFGRTFYILETKYKIDHIPKHAKSEIKALKGPDFE